MQFKVYATLVSLVLSTITYSQASRPICTLYLTPKEFMEGKPSFDVASQSKKIKIKLNDLLVRPYVTVQQNESDTKFYKKNTFGFRTCDNQFYRFKNNMELLLVNPGDSISIFKNLHTKIHKGASINATNYYFSLGPSGNLGLLTIKNLKAAFSGNRTFQALIDQHFRTNSQLGAIESGSNSYQVTLLFKQSLL